LSYFVPGTEDKKIYRGQCLPLKIKIVAGCQWLMPVILATWEAEIRKIEVQSQPGQIVHKTLS
jgi:hypothetical protein